MKMMKRIQRSFIPGSEWIYIKVYTGSNTADKILVNELTKIISVLERKKYMEKWFFIRYSDPDFHLRIRILVKDVGLIGEILRLFYKYFSRLVENDWVWKIQLDTYNRELERYNGHLMELTETLFYIDSTHTLKLLRILEDMPLSARWLIAAKMIDCLLIDFNYNLRQRRELLESMDKSYKMEFGYNEFNSKQFNLMYREHFHELEEVIWGIKADEGYKALYNILELRSNALKTIAQQLIEANDGKGELIPISSYIHMMLIRLFRSKNRLYELVVYNLMSRFYSSWTARIKYCSHVDY